MKIKTILSTVFLLMFFLAAIADAATIIVRPGKFDHFTLEAPDRIIAGEPFIIKALVYDLQNNLITDFSESGKEFRVTVTGSATVQPSHLSHASFRGGAANISVTDKRAERIVFSIFQADGSIPLVSKELLVLPNKLDHFDIQTPSQARAGQAFEAKIVAKDTFGNTVSDVELAGKNVTTAPVGTISFKAAAPSVTDFVNGTASVSLVAEKIGSVAVEVQEPLSGSRGRSQPVIITPAALSYFKLLVPSDVTAGEPFEITLAAHDAYGNPVTDYTSAGNGVMLQSSGTSKIEPSFIKPSEFKGHEATVKVSYDKAEEIAVLAKEQDRNQSGKSNLIRVGPAAADHFVVLTPGDAASGQPFKIRIEAYDRFNNRVKHYNLAGSNVYLKTTGTGILSPSVISPAEFVDGIASVDVIYDKAESFAVSAAMQPSAFAERIFREKKPAEKIEKKVEEKQVPSVPETPETKETPRAKVERKEPVKPHVKEAQKETPKKEVVEEKKAEEIKKEAKKEAKKETPKKEVVKEKKAEEVKKEAKKEAKHEPPSKEPKQPLSLSNISLIEAKEKAMLVISITPAEEHFEFKERIESRQGKEWLKIRFKPVTRKTEKSIKLRSEFIGSVLVEEDPSEQGVVNVFVELKPEKVTFDVARLRNSLIVTVAKP